MEALKRFALALGVLALGCGDDDDGDDKTGRMDASTDGSIDSSVSDGGRDGGDGGKRDASTFACSPSTPASGMMCGSGNCLQTAEELKATVSSTGACTKDAELEEYCSTKSIAAVSRCILNPLNFTAPDPAAATKKCATPALPDYTSGCLDCFVQAAVCAAVRCKGPCLEGGSASAECDECRLAEGCLTDFYTCTGIHNPYPGM